MRRLSRKDRAAAAKAPTYLAVPGPSVAHPLARAERHDENRKAVYLRNGQTLVQPPLPPLLHPWFVEPTPDHAPRTLPGEEPVEYDGRDIIPLEHSPPPPDPNQHRRKRTAQ